MDETLEVADKTTKRKIFFSRIKRRILKHIWLTRITLMIAVLFLLVAVLLSGLLVFKRSTVSFYGKLLSDFIFTPADKIKSVDGRTNILILGIGGLGHEAPDLSDTMMVASVSDRNLPTIFVSLPRDIWIPDLRAKLNSAYYWGKEKSGSETGGFVLAKSTVEEIIGIPIQHTILIDFSGFKDIIDSLGGIDVNVENSFIDTKYPIPGKESDSCGGDKELKCRYETIQFTKGITHMNGETALKFVRSRNSEGDEGTDLARAARQQKVIKAIKDKVLRPEIYSSPKKIRELLKLVDIAVDSDLDPTTMAILVRYIVNSKEQIKSYVLSPDFLVNPPITAKYDNQYVFIPKKGDWSDVQLWYKTILSGK